MELKKSRKKLKKLKVDSVHLSIFDLDHTLTSVNCSFYFGKYLFHHGLFSSFKMIYFVFLYLRHRLFYLSLEKLHKKTFKHLFKGLHINQIEQLVAQFLAKEFVLICRHSVLGCLEQAKKKNHFTVIMSSSPDFLVKAIAHKLGVDLWYGTDYVVDNNGILSHIGNICSGEKKGSLCQTLLKQLQLTKINSTAYSDSYLDLPLLEACGFPVAVNPDKALLAICEQKKWSVM